MMNTNAVRQDDCYNECQVWLHAWQYQLPVIVGGNGSEAEDLLLSDLSFLNLLTRDPAHASWLRQARWCCPSVAHTVPALYSRSTKE